MRLSLLILILSLTTACGYKNPRDAKLTDHLMTYHRMVRGNSFDQAALYYHLSPTHLTTEQRDAFDGIRITGYDVLVRNSEDNGNKLKQVVKIRYVDEGTQKEHSLTDEQTWLWNKENKRWYLDGELPQFVTE